MLMRFHWGMAVGHAYAHPSKPDEDPEVVPSTHDQTDSNNTISNRDCQHTGSEEPMEVDAQDYLDLEHIHSDTDSDDSSYERPDEDSTEETSSSSSTRGDDQDSEDSEDAYL